MSWSEKLPFAHRARRLAILALALPAAGCFQPLYGEAAHPGVVAEMRAISVAPINDRIGHYLGNDLIFNLNGSGDAPAPKYKLTVKVSVSNNTPTITSQINISNSTTVSAEAKFVLAPIEGGDPVIEAQATAVTVYDRTEQRFANLRAGRDAEIKLAKALAEEIEIRIAAALGAPE